MHFVLRPVGVLAAFQQQTLSFRLVCEHCSSEHASVFPALTNHVCIKGTPRIKVPLEKLIFTHTTYTFYGTWRFIIVRAHYWPLSRAIWIQPASSHTISLRFLLIIPYYLCLDLHKCPLPFKFSNQNLYTFFISPMHTHLLLDSIMLIMSGEEYKLWSSSCSFLQLHVISWLQGADTALSTLFSNILSLCSFLMI
jgi:hypothetical protein